MDNLSDLKTIWLSASTKGLPASAEVVRMAKSYRKKKIRNKIAMIICGLISTILLISVVFIYKSTMLTTRIGEGCMLLSGAILVATNTNSIGRFYRFTDFNNREYIQFLEQTGFNQIYYYKKTQVAAFTLSSVGLSLYVFEMVHINLNVSIVVYSLIIAYFLLLWLVVRPRTFKKQAKKLDDEIKKLEK